MHDTRVILKDGRVFIGPIWAYNTQSWYITIPSVTDELLYFRDMESATVFGSRHTAYEVGLDEDLLARARHHGWNGID